MKKVKKGVNKKGTSDKDSWEGCGGNCKCGKGKGSTACGGCFYFLGFVGSAIYYISTASSFGVGLWGVIKSLVWPAFIVFELMKFFGM